MKNTLKKWYKWEFWPFWFFYFPLYIKYLWLALKARSLAFFTVANPLMEYGGFVDYSKNNVLKAIDKKYLPITEFFLNADEISILKKMEEINIGFPIILKPDKGERGFGVQKIDNIIDLSNYFKKYGTLDSLILQEYIAYPIEIGVMYSRKPSEEKGQITSLVMKEFLTITGNGKDTLEEILHKDNRASLYLKDLLNIYKNDLSTIIKKGKKKELVAIGNHCRGTTFLNVNHLINENLHNVFDEISLPIKGFYFGRYDLRVPSIEDLYKGENIKIMELNGAASEPAHIYDPNMPLLKAYKYLFAHWQRLYEISIENRKKGFSYDSSWQLYLAMKQNVKFKKEVKNV